MHHLMHTARIPGPGDAYRVPPGPSDAYTPAWMKADTITTRTRSGRWTTRTAPCSSPARRAPGKARSSGTGGASTPNRNILTLAPTGIAALNVQGVTMHRFMHAGPSITPAKAAAKGRELSGDRLYRALDSSRWTR